MSLCWRSLPLLVLVLCVAYFHVSEAQLDCAASEADCHCSRRLRLENTSGIIVDHFGGSDYNPQTHCLFYLDSSSSMSSIRLKFNLFDLECRWDYLYVFTGDSIYSDKIAALTGDLLVSDPESGVPIPAPEYNETNSTGGSGMGMDSDPIPFREPYDITLVSPGSILLLYFFTDAGVNKAGFNVSYWINYTCPEDCLGRGNCSEKGKCECVEGWTGESCEVPTCPNDCFNNGQCTSDGCQCPEDFTGVDCSIPVSHPHWRTVDYTITGNLTEEQLARASHSSLVWGDYVIVYGGYRFPTAVDGPVGSGSGSGDTGERGEEVTGPQLLRYHISSGVWTELEVNQSSPHPAPRYGHSAVLYNDTMYIFGGVLIPDERITDEHWAFHLPTLTWSPLTLHTDNDITYSPNNSTTTVGADVDVAIETTNEDTPTVPIRVRGHTAHVFGSTMVVLFGMTDLENNFINFVQEYDFSSGEWSVPSQYGVKPSGRMGHSSLYDTETGLVYVYGGHTQRKVSDELLVYDPLARSWFKRSSGPSKAYFHSSALLWGQLILVFGGSGDDCFSDQLLVYNLACDEWFTESYLGLPGDARRIGHTAFIDSSQESMVVFGGFLGQPFGDVLQLVTGNCSVYTSEGDCTNGTVFCGWASATNSCVPLAHSQDNPLPSCSVEECLVWSSCDNCTMSGGNCTWSEKDNSCQSGVPNNATCPQPTSEGCGRFSNSCHGCLAHGCQWTNESKCVASGLNVTSKECSTPCSSSSTCSDCTEGSCLWCPSLNQCIASPTGTHSYAYTYPFGQCLGYVSSRDSCPEPCESYITCDKCHDHPECGWCRDPSDTGLGTCSEGGFLLPLTSSPSCPSKDWFFEQCPACQCNGHSACVNESVCEECQDNTSGSSCEFCAEGYFGDAEGGGTCTECDCNGYDADCNRRTGTCSCHDVGVLGPNCTICNINNSYVGNADNFCYYKMSVGFVYTFGVTELRERESFYLAVPEDDVTLKFEFDITKNPNDQDVIIQLFLGKASERFWVLANLTGPIRVRGGGKYSTELNDESGDHNTSDPRLFSFAHPRLRDTSNFTNLFYRRNENHYTTRMWNGDVALIVRVSNLTSGITFKITLDQTNLWFLLYFFSTFIICFTFLLTAFMIGWYLKRKIEMRRYIRQQYRDLRRRVARPFSRIKLIVQSRQTDRKLPEQRASYVSAQTCKSGKAGVLTTFIQLPGDGPSGRPAPGRTGLCVGTALVKVSKRSTRDRGTKGKERRRGGGGDEEEVGIQSAGEGERNGSLRERIRDSSITPATDTRQSQ